MLRQVHHVGDRVGDVVGRERLEPLVHRLGALAVAVEPHFGEFRLHEAGVHLGHTDRRARHVEVHALGQCTHTELRRVVYIAHRIGLMPGRTPDVHDVPAAPRHHMRQDRPRHVEQPFQVGVDHAVPILGVAFVHLRQAAREAGVVDEHVGHLSGRDQRLRRPVHGGAVAHVHLSELRDHAVLRLEGPGERLQPRAAPRPQREPCTFGGEAARAGLPNSRARTSDQNQLSLDAIHRIFPVWPNE